MHGITVHRCGSGQYSTYISNNERTPNVTKKHGAKGLGKGQREVECTIHLTIRPQIQRGETTVHRAGQEEEVYTIDLYAKKDSRKPGKMWYFFCARESKKKEIYHAREDAIKPRCRVQLPSGPHTGTIPHHAVRSSRQSMRFTPCLLVISASPGVRLHR